jgi:hypothetical protein
MCMLDLSTYCFAQTSQQRIGVVQYPASIGKSLVEFPRLVDLRLPK